MKFHKFIPVAASLALVACDVAAPMAAQKVIYFSITRVPPESSSSVVNFVTNDPPSITAIIARS